MPFDWQDFLSLARSILAQVDAGAVGPPEAAYRAMISRAYYAAFGHSHDYAVRWLDFTAKKRAEERSQDHGRLRAHLRARRRETISRYLGQLRDWRNDCDYVASLPGVNLRELVHDALGRAKYIIEGLPPPKAS